ncbi:unnamed protein product [Brachionus calyciflorus]|uniref:Uncharacterized protein n=1 Tax=Brachionus calyciflorus TaxID=104777 RepID=A0A813XX75_9BILA|nr:unnamed protein product [Brachionus calyciflorus]
MANYQLGVEELSDTQLYVHFDKSLKINEEESDKIIQDGLLNLAGDIGVGECVRPETTFSIFRRMNEIEAISILEQNGFDATRMASKDSEKWVSESLTKVLNFKNNGVSEEVIEKIAEIKVGKDFWNDFKKELISQYKSKNQGKSVFNFEGIPDVPQHPKSEISQIAQNQIIPKNVGIKKDHVSQVNSNIESIKVFDPQSPFIRNKFLRYLSNNKLKLGMLALDLIIEGNNLRLAVLNSNGSYLSAISLSLINLTARKIGQALGGMIGNFVLPGIVTTIGSLIGGIIFGLIGKQIGKFILCLFSDVKVAPGPGIKLPEYWSMVFDNMYGIRETEYSIDELFDIRPLGYQVNGGVRKMDYDMQSCFGIRKPDYS